MINFDFADLLQAFADAEVRYLIVGGLALAFHDRPRFTKDLDVFIDRSPENATRVYAALARFGAPLDRLSIEDLQSPELVFQIGVDPVRIDILTDIDGVSFERAWTRRIEQTYGDVICYVIGREDLVANKRATGRLQDLADVEQLRSLASEPPSS